MSHLRIASSPFKRAQIGTGPEADLPLCPPARASIRGGGGPSATDSKATILPRSDSTDLSES